MINQFDRMNITFYDTSLSANMEDYMEAIVILAEKKKVVRVKDIAKSLNIKMPSVTSALQKLNEKGLIIYEKYGYVDLTDEGRIIAERIYQKHSCLSAFFKTVLKMDSDEANNNACKIEHHLSPDACSKLYKLLEFFNYEKSKNKQWVNELENLLEEKPLSELHSGDSAEIISVNAEEKLKKRLIELGLRKGEIVKIIRYAPLKDPLQIMVKGYNLSIRVNEAKSIIVKKINNAENSDE